MKSKISKYKSSDLKKFVHESNAIEDVFSVQADEDGINAIVTAITLLADKKVTTEKILEIHGIILKHLDPTIAGKLRPYDVRVGWRLCPYHVEVPGLVKALCEKKFPTTAKAIKQWHIEYEGIHPHCDGNGRTGRAILAAQTILAGLPLKVIKADKRHEYYAWFS